MNGEYPLGHGAAEIARLAHQSTLYAGHSEHILRIAGLAPGMRVLDVGCGPGDLAMLAARLTGPAGSVLGVDASPAAVRLARDRVAAAGVDNASFTHGVLPEVDIDAPVDAVIGRLILMHLDDPVSAVRRLAARVRPGGLVIFQEFVVSGMWAEPDIPLYREVRDRVVAALRAAGRDPDFGLRLPGVFRAAGLGDPALTCGAPMSAGSDPAIFQYAVDTLRTLAPAEPATLADRLREQGERADAVVFAPAIVGGWARVPAR